MAVESVAFIISVLRSFGVVVVVGEAFVPAVRGFGVEGDAFEVRATFVADETPRVETLARGAEDASRDGEGAVGA